MRRQYLGVVSLSVAVYAAALSAPVHGTELAHGVAITGALALRELDLEERTGDPAKGFSLARMLGAPATASSRDLLSLPSMQPLRATLDAEIERYAAQRSSLQPFDREALYEARTRFVLSAIVNRMDRSYKSPATCGEVRLIFRPVRNFNASPKSGEPQPQRLPMTLNLVLNARNADDMVSCADLARRWLALDALSASGADLAAALTAEGGALELISPRHIDRIEINMQIAHASPNPNDFDARADYLLKTFRYDGNSKTFGEAPLENQIDAERIAHDPALATEFSHWILTPENLAALDRGTVLIPQKFLAPRAIALTPPGAGSDNGVSIAENDVIEALARASATGQDFQNIRSPAGFARRLDDITCAGCHRTRAIGGFHMPGADWRGSAPDAVVTPVSPHFAGDQPRRRDILAAFRDGRPPDFARGFSARPQAPRSAELAGTTYLNGWGAVCYAQPADASFTSWTCAEGLTCQVPAASTSANRAGFCFPQSN